MPRTETATPPPELVILDWLDVTVEVNQMVAGGFIQRRGTRTNATFSDGVPILSTSAGIGHLTVLRGGTGWYQVTSPGAIQQSGRFAVHSRCPVPLGCDQTGIPAAALRPVRVDFVAVLERTLPLVATIQYGIKDGFGISSGLLDSKPEAGHEVVSIPEVNAGRWTYRVRAVAGGAILAFDSGVAAGAPALVGVRYEHTSNPRAAGLINGVEFAAVQGIAAVPKTAVVGDQGSVAVTQNTPNAVSAGQVDFHRLVRFTISQLPGF